MNALLFIGIGAYFSIHGAIGIFAGELHSETHPGLQLLESLDMFLIALVFLIFALGITKLFHPGFGEKGNNMIPEWLKIKDFTGLKLILWETILISLVVLFVNEVVKADGHFEWTILLIPGAIFLLAVSLLLLKKGEGH